MKFVLFVVIEVWWACEFFSGTAVKFETNLYCKSIASFFETIISELLFNLWTPSLYSHDIRSIRSSFGEKALEGGVLRLKSVTFG